MRNGSRQCSAWRRTRRADTRSRRAWTRAPRSSKTRITRSARRTAANPGRSARKTGCATTITSSRIRSASPPGPAAELLPRAAQAGGRAVRGLSACLRAGARADRAYRRPHRSRDASSTSSAAYQRASPLSIGETWAIPIMLRLALVEELRRLADGVVEARRSREMRAAGTGRSRMPSTEQRESDRSCCFAESRRQTAACPRRSSSSCCSGCATSRPAAAPAWQALHRALEAQDDSPEEMLRIEHQREADRPAGDRQRHQRACGCCRRSTGRCSSSASAWSNTSCATIRRAPTRRWTSRRAIATGTRSRSSPGGHACRKLDVAQACGRALRRGGAEHDPAHDRRHHVGYYLISRGRFDLEQELGYRPTCDRARSRGSVFAHPALGYLGHDRGS